MTSLSALGEVACHPDDIEREFTEAALAGAGWPALLAQLRRETGAHCRLVDPHGAVLVSTNGGNGLSTAELARAIAGEHVSVAADDGWRARAAVACVRGRLAGVLLLAEPATPRQLAILDAAVTAVLIEAVRRDAARLASYPDGAAVVAALRRGEAEAAAVGAAARFGLDLATARTGAVLAYIGDCQRTWKFAVSQLDRLVQREESLAWLVVRDPAELVELRDRLELTVGAGAVRAACGSAVDEPTALHRSFAEAALLLRIGAARGDPELPFPDAGLLQLLLAVPRERLRYFVMRHLGPILERPELLTTLQAWLAAGGSRLAVSERLHLHRNSVGYRVGQLKQLLGVDPLEPPNAAILHAALAAREVLAADR
jgi:hypothetical protein